MLYRESEKQFTLHTMLENNNIIRFTEITNEEAGVYTCTAKNEAGHDDISVTLTVLEDEEQPSVLIQPDSLTVIEGQNAEFRCIVKGFCSFHS